MIIEQKGQSDKLEKSMKEDFSAFEYFSYRLEEVFKPEFTKSSTFDKGLKSTTGGIENAEYGELKSSERANICIYLYNDFLL